MATANTDVKTIFSKALEIESSSERAAYLNDACQGNSGLRREVEELLKALEKAGSFMAEPASQREATESMPRIAEGPGTMIGPYTVNAPSDAILRRSRVASASGKWQVGKTSTLPDLCGD